MEEVRNCLECGQKVMGRADKKFCSDMCRNTYNNRLTSFSNATIKTVNSILKKNRKILDELCPEDKIKVPKSTLINKGFLFNYLTHLRKTLKGHTYYFTFDMGILELENDFILIVRDKKDQ